MVLNKAINVVLTPGVAEQLKSLLSDSHPVGNTSISSSQENSSKEMGVSAMADSSGNTTPIRWPAPAVRSDGGNALTGIVIPNDLSNGGTLTPLWSAHTHPWAENSSPSEQDTTFMSKPALIAKTLGDIHFVVSAARVWVMGAQNGGMAAPIVVDLGRTRDVLGGAK